MRINRFDTSVLNEVIEIHVSKHANNWWYLANMAASAKGDFPMGLKQMSHKVNQGLLPENIDPNGNKITQCVLCQKIYI
eukprot:UN07691